MKKTLSLLMSLIMLFSIAAGASVTANAEEYDEIRLGQTKTVTVTASETADDLTYFLFAPAKSGYYYFYSTGNMDTMGIAIYGETESDDPEVVMEDDNYKNGNFLIEMYLYRGDMAVLTAGAYETGTFNVTLSDKAPADYVPCKHSSIDRTNAVKATCTEDGYTGDLLCLDCGKVFEIGEAVPKSATIRRSRDEIVYTGTVQRPMITVYDRNGDALTYKKDFTVDYSDWNSTDVGEYTVTVNMIGNYEDTRTYTYRIVPQTNVTPKLNRYIITTTGTVQRPLVTVTDKNGNQLEYKKDFTVDYSDWYSTDVGRYTVTVKMQGNYSGEMTYPYYINPKPTTFLSSAQGGFKGVKNGFTLTWNKQTEQTTGYQIQYATKRDFSNAASYWVEDNNITSATITGRAAETRYYVRIRPYTQIGNGTFYGSWDYEDSYIKSIVTK